MIKLRTLLYVFFIILGQKLSAQEATKQLSCVSGDSIRVIMKSGLYNYGIFSSQTDSTLEMYIDNQKYTTLLNKDRIAETKIFSKAVPAIIDARKAPNTEPYKTISEPNNQSLSSNRYTPIARIRVGDNIELKLKSGLIIKGIVTKNMVSSLIVKTKDNTLTIPKQDIKHVVNLREIDTEIELDTYLNSEESNFTRYFFAPSAIKLKQGMFTYDNSYLFANFLTYNPTDFLSVTAGTELITLLAGEPMYMIAPHAGFKVMDNLYIGGGFFHFNAVLDNVKLNALFGTVTLGDQNKNATINIGKGLQANSTYTVNVSGFMRLSKNFGLITENWFSRDLEVLEDLPLLGLGGRVISKSITFDFALVSFIPYVGFSARF